MNRKALFLGIFAFLAASLVPSARALYEILPSELSASIGVGGMPILYYDEPAGAGQDNPRQENKADFTFTIKPGESISFDLQIAASDAFPENRSNGNSTFVTLLEGEAVPLYGSSLEGLDINCDIQYPFGSFFYGHETLHVQNLYDGKLSGGYNYPIRVDGGETAKVSISLDAGRSEPVSFCLTLGAYPTETYEYAYVVGKGITNWANEFKDHPSYRMTPIVDAAVGQLIWEWTAKNEGQYISNDEIKALIEINEATGPTIYWSDGGNWIIHSDQRIKRVTWINDVGETNPYKHGIQCEYA